MNTKLNLAVASALLAVASSANAGISIPAGDWTVDIGGNVNAFYIHNNSNDNATVDGGLANTESVNGNSSASSINTGLLPSWLGIGAKTRQNDLDVGWTISFQPGASSAHALQGGGGSEFRQAFLTFGDKSWGTIKIGKDLGVFGQDAILNDQTLLGVGSQGLVGTAGGTTTTLGRIGTGFLYADFKGQINYTSPNWNGFSFTAGIAQPWQAIGPNSGTSAGSQKTPAFEGKASYDWAGDVSGKVWGEFFTQKVDGIGATAGSAAGITWAPNPAGTAFSTQPVAAVAASNGQDETARAFGVGAKVAVAGFDLVGYYYDAKGVGTTALLFQGFAANGNRRDSDGWYLQAGFTIPGAGTRIAGSYGESNLDRASGEAKSTLVKQNDMWTLGVYHPLTKHVNLVAEYSQVKAENHLGADNKSNIFDLGAILFF